MVRHLERIRWDSQENFVYARMSYEQIQNDVYGSVIMSATQFFFDRRLSVTGDTRQFELLVPEIAVDRRPAPLPLRTQPDLSSVSFRFAPDFSRLYRLLI